MNRFRKSEQVYLSLILESNYEKYKQNLCVVGLYLSLQINRYYDSQNLWKNEGEEYGL